jgi:hypothetical protein
MYEQEISRTRQEESWTMTSQRDQTAERCYNSGTTHKMSATWRSVPNSA